MRNGIRLICMALLLAAAWLVGCAPSSGSLTVQDAWARPGKAGENSAVYFVLDNGTGQADSLLGAACDAAMLVEVHKTETDSSGNAMMRRQDAVEIPARQSLDFKPGGLHIMLMNLQRDLQPGETLNVTLQFAGAGEVPVTAAVRAP